MLKPLFDELEELGEPLDEEEFVDAANRLYEVSLKPFLTLFLQTLSQNDKNHILTYGKQKSDRFDYQMENCTFKPKINDASFAKLSKQRPSSAHMGQKSS